MAEGLSHKRKARREGGGRENRGGRGEGGERGGEGSMVSTPEPSR